MPAGAPPPGSVAGAESDMHELPASKFHEVCERERKSTGGQETKSKNPTKKTHTPFPPPQADTCYTITMDALGADTPADVELAVFEDKDVVLKLGSGHRTLVALPAGGDAGGVSGELGGGQFKLMVQKKQ